MFLNFFSNSRNLFGGFTSKFESLNHKKIFYYNFKLHCAIYFFIAANIGAEVHERRDLANGIQNVSVIENLSNSAYFKMK